MRDNFSTISLEKESELAPVLEARGGGCCIFNSALMAIGVAVESGGRLEDGTGGGAGAGGCGAVVGSGPPGRGVQNMARESRDMPSDGCDA
eukprot:1321695-Amorphochlora_amoeboformis.AAC.2